jgi:hypothetical protein
MTETIVPDEDGDQSIHAQEASLTHQLYVAAIDEGDEVEYPNHKLLTFRPDGMV